MKSDGITLHNLHWLQTFQPCFLGKFIIAFIPITFQVAGIGYISYIANLVPQVPEIAVDNIK